MKKFISVCILPFVFGCSGIDTGDLFNTTRSSSSGVGGSETTNSSGTGGANTSGSTTVGAGGTGGNKANCVDGVKNGSETDVDCGGDCVGCDAEKHCSINTDCISKYCLRNTCVKCVMSDKMQGPACDFPFDSSVTSDTIAATHCVGEVCEAYGCYSNNANCNGNWIDGCEVNTLNNSMNCGVTCIVCLPGQICTGNPQMCQ